VQDQKGKEKIQKILNIGLADNVKAHEMQPDGSYARVRKKGRESIQSQSVFIEWAQKRTEQ
jgi:polyphosphate kinase